MLGKLKELRVSDIDDMVGIAADAQDIGGFFSLLKLDESTSAEDKLRMKMLLRRVWLLRPAGHITHWSECVQSSKPKSPKSAEKCDESSDDEIDPVERRSLLGEFARRRGYNIPLYQQVSERTFGTLMKQHVSRSLPVVKLSNIVVILDENQHGDKDKQVTTSGGKLKVTKHRQKSHFHLPDANFLAYLKTLLYGYAICSLKDAGGRPRFTLNVVLEYYDTFGQLVVKDCNFGGAAKNLILQADLVLRTEIFRLNDATTTQYGRISLPTNMV